MRADGPRNGAGGGAAADKGRLETGRLVLRRFTEADAGHLVDLDSDPAVMRFLTGGRPTPRHVIETEVLPGYLAAYDRHPGFGHWAAEEAATGTFLGWFEFRPEPEAAGAHDVELGYRLRASAWGRGYATEGARALVRRGFARLGVERVFATTMAVNRGSRRVMEKAGLRYVRTVHAAWPDPIQGAEHGDVEYELLRADWRPYDAP